MKNTIQYLFIAILIIFFITVFYLELRREEPNNAENSISNNYVQNEMSENSVQEDTFKPTEAKYLDDFYGIYGDYGYESIEVLPGKDDDHVNINYGVYRAEGFGLENFPITRSKDGAIYGNTILTDDFGKSFEGVEAKLSIEDGNIKISFDKNVLMFPRDESKNTELEYQKTSSLILLESSKEEALMDVVRSNGNSINYDIFTVEKFTENYIVLKCECFLYSGDGYYLNGYSISDMTKYYNYNRKENKFVSLEDIAGNKMNDVNEYIKDEIEKMKENWENGIFRGEEIDYNQSGWPYREFEGIGAVGYLDNYFLVDETKQIVRIRVLDYPTEAEKALGDICVDVPFRYFEKVI